MGWHMVVIHWRLNVLVLNLNNICGDVTLVASKLKCVQ